MIEFIEHLEEVPDGSSDPIRSPDKNYLEAAPTGVPQQLVETRTPSFRSRDPIGVFGDDLKTPLLGHRAKIMQLRLRMLVDSGYAQI